MLTLPLVENELFSSHWDDEWDILNEDKHSERSSDEDDDENIRQRGVNKGRDDDGQNGKQNDKEYEEEEEEDVEQIREEISKVIENVMQTSIDQDNPASHFGIRPSSSSRRRRHRPFPSRELNSSSRGMSADHLASSPPSTFEIQHDHQPIRGRKSHIDPHNRQHQSNKLAETIEYTPETETPNVSPTLRFSKTVPPGNTLVRQESSEEESSEEQSNHAQPTGNSLCEVAVQQESGEEDSSEEESSEEGSSEDEEVSSEEESEEESGEEEIVAINLGEPCRLRVPSRSDINNSCDRTATILD
jgi:hypothetical protein